MIPFLKFITIICGPFLYDIGYMINGLYQICIHIYQNVFRRRAKYVKGKIALFSKNDQKKTNHYDKLSKCDKLLIIIKTSSYKRSPENKPDSMIKEKKGKFVRIILETQIMIINK